MQNDTTHTLNFTDHRRQLLENRYVYAVVSRRAQGLSIGVNLNPDAFCNFDCPYCQVDRRIPSTKNKKIDLLILEKELQHIHFLITTEQLWEVAPFNTVEENMRVVRDISISGDGEPTVCPNFQESLQLVIQTHQAIRAFQERRSLAPEECIRLQVFSNATVFHKPSVRESLGLLWQHQGVVWAKLDAGTQPWFEKVSGSSISLDLIVGNITWAASQYPIVIQAMFHAFASTKDGVEVIEKPTDAEIEAWLGRLEKIITEGQGENRAQRISWIQIYTTIRRPAQESVVPLSKEALESIADKARALCAKISMSTRISVST